MKTEITKQGYLEITPENRTEDYALSKWIESAWVERKSLETNTEGYYREESIYISRL